MHAKTAFCWALCTMSAAYKLSLCWSGSLGASPKVHPKRTFEISIIGPHKKKHTWTLHGQLTLPALHEEICRHFPDASSADYTLTWATSNDIIDDFQVGRHRRARKTFWVSLLDAYLCHFHLIGIARAGLEQACLISMSVLQGTVSQWGEENKITQILKLKLLSKGFSDFSLSEGLEYLGFPREYVSLGIPLLQLCGYAADLPFACVAKQAYGTLSVFSQHEMFMQEIMEADANEFAAEDLADGAAVDGQTSTFGTLLQHFAEDLCLRRSVLGYMLL